MRVELGQAVDREAFELEHLQVAADRAGDDAQALVGVGEPGDELLDVGALLGVLLPPDGGALVPSARTGMTASPASCSSSAAARVRLKGRPSIGRVQVGGEGGAEALGRRPRLQITRRRCAGLR